MSHSHQRYQRNRTPSLAETNPGSLAPDYVSQDFCQYWLDEGCNPNAGTRRASIWSAASPQSPRPMPISTPYSVAKRWSMCPSPPMRWMNSPDCSSQVASSPPPLPQMSIWRPITTAAVFRNTGISTACNSGGSKSNR